MGLTEKEIGEVSRVAGEGRIDLCSEIEVVCTRTESVGIVF